MPTNNLENIWHPALEGQLIRLRPLVEEDFDALYAVGSDPEIWEQHPESTRYKVEEFRRFFRSGIESKGAFMVLNRADGRVIDRSERIHFANDHRDLQKHLLPWQLPRLCL